ncbi:S53 family peptidase [Bradyrhizobium japonicum]|uniref:S53 family peptidase n=1 Tax=Bradyrhizobium japonicum TaxID=375 RepID=UPI002714A722|nr:S53 family peptidase [Bradyrhizobium japonicum]WLB18879.1 S53 family peptidase [Bradyrhizobium japonicum]
MTTLAGSHRTKPQGAQACGKVEANEPIVVWVYLKNPSARRRTPGSASDLAALAQPTSRRALGRQRAAEYAPAFIEVAKFARQNGLTVHAVQADRRCVVLKGRAARMTKAFSATLHIYDSGHRRFRARTGALKVPISMGSWTRAVLGFDQRPQAGPSSTASAPATPGLWPSEVAALYGVPLEPVSKTQCIGIIALGGGYLASDVAQAAAQAGRPPPTIIEQSVDDVTNQFGGGTPADQEIALDMQVVAGVVPAAKIIIYFAPNTAAGLAAAIHQAVFDDENRPQVLSISWGSAEKVWRPGPRDAVQAALADAVMLKVSVAVASGDLLATGGLSDGAAHVFFPSSSPYVLGCGGTQVSLESGAIASEDVWKEGYTGSGGGISDLFAIPAFQKGITLPSSIPGNKTGRGVPDVAAAAARIPGYRIILGGTSIVKDGTSAVAPLWAGIIALANAQRGTPLGLVNPILYSDPGWFRPIVRGDNCVGSLGYSAAPGLLWNACTGLGTPRGAAIVAGLAADGAPAA